MPIEISPTIPLSPEIKILITGLFVLKFEREGNHCDLFINKEADGHLFSVTLRAKQRDEADYTLFRHYGDLRNRLLSIDVTRPQAGTERVRRHQVGDTLNRPGAPEPQKHDLRWMPDFPTFHPDKTLKLIYDEPHIRINNGVFYTARKTNPARVKVSKVKEGVEEDLFRVPSLIGSAIKLQENGYAEINIGGTVQYHMENLSSQGISYEIYIENDPVTVAHSHGRITSHFDQYYKMIHHVPGGSEPPGPIDPREQFDVVYDPLEPRLREILKERSRSSTPDVPCMPTECTSCG